MYKAPKSQPRMAACQWWKQSMENNLLRCIPVYTQVEPRLCRIQSAHPAAFGCQRVPLKSFERCDLKRWDRLFELDWWCLWPKLKASNTCWSGGFTEVNGNNYSARNYSYFDIGLLLSMISKIFRSLSSIRPESTRCWRVGKRRLTLNEIRCRVITYAAGGKIKRENVGKSAKCDFTYQAPCIAWCCASLVSQFLVASNHRDGKMVTINTG